MRRRYLKRREGFTLIELLIVLAIIGVLMTIGIPIYRGTLEGAKAAVVASNMRIVVDGLRTDLTVNGKPSVDGVAEGKFYDASGTYIKVDSKAKGKYYFAYNDSGSDWKIDVAYDYGSANKSFLSKIGDKLAGCDEIYYTNEDVAEKTTGISSSTNLEDINNSRGIICELSFQKIGY